MGVNCEATNVYKTILSSQDLVMSQPNTGEFIQVNTSTTEAHCLRFQL